MGFWLCSCPHHAEALQEAAGLARKNGIKLAQNEQASFVAQTQAEVAAAAGVTQGAVAQATNKNVQQNGIISDPPPSTRDTRRYAALSQIEGSNQQTE